MTKALFHLRRVLLMVVNLLMFMSRANSVIRISSIRVVLRRSNVSELTSIIRNVNEGTTLNRIITTINGRLFHSRKGPALPRESQRRRLNDVRVALRLTL